MCESDAEKLLIFSARLVTDLDEDAEDSRFFAINYYLTDKSVAIYEKKDGRKGIAGRRFLARTKVKDPLTGAGFDDGEFYVGAKVAAAGRLFELVDAPEFTLAQVEANARRFPVGDLQYAVDALGRSVGAATVTSAFAAKDRSKSGKVSAADARAVLFRFAPPLVKHAVLTLLRRFTDGDAFAYGDLLAYL
jgi:hypothetical protein